MAIDHDQWLALTVEEAVEPDLAVCDPHHHLWDRGAEGRYLVPELIADTAGGHDVRTTVFVECGASYATDGPDALRPVGETAFVVAAAEECARLGGPDIAGIVATADLRLGPVLHDVLAAHAEAAAGRFRGIRHRVANDPTGSAGAARGDTPAGLLGDPAFRHGVGVLGQAGLSFDAWLFHPQLPELLAMARAVPATTIVVNHLGAPLGTDAFAQDLRRSRADWRSGLEPLASCPNVVVKLGGIGMPLFGNPWHLQERPPTSDQIVEEWGPAIRWVIDTFTPDRCMFESNFPPDRASCSYTVLWNAFKKLSAPYAAAERAALLHDTAMRVYRLGPD